MYLRESQHYENLYDRLTVERARRNMADYNAIYDKWFEILPDEPTDSMRSTLHLNMIYMSLVGQELVERYEQRNERIKKMMSEDKAKDAKVSDARLPEEPTCRSCNKTGLRIIDKQLMHRDSVDDPEEVVFMLTCSHCQVKSAYREDGTRWQYPQTHCPQCQSSMDDTHTDEDNSITTTYTCPSCGHIYQEELELGSTTEQDDHDFETDKAFFCLHDAQNLQAHRDAKSQFEGLARMGKEFREREENKEVYEAVANTRKLNVPQLPELLIPALEEAGYTEFSIGKPNMGRYATVDFDCLDSNTDRSDYDSRKALRKVIKQTLGDTNWRLTSAGISYRLGYLSGRLRAYESEEELKKLVSNNK